jgi:hypothetical protein
LKRCAGTRHLGQPQHSEPKRTQTYMYRHGIVDGPYAKVIG